MILIIFLVSYLIHFFLSTIIVEYLFKEVKNAQKLFTQALVPTTLIILFFYFANTQIFSFEYLRSQRGVFNDDEYEFLVSAISLSENNFVWIPTLKADWAIGWLYILAINIYLFGSSYILLIIPNIFLYSIGSVAFYSISLKSVEKEKVAVLSYWLFTFFVPLLYYSATILKELFLAFITLMVIYSYFNILVDRVRYQWLLLLFIFLFLMFLTRHQYTIVISILILITYLFVSEKALVKKAMMLLAFGLLVFIIYDSDFVRKLTIIDKIQNANQRALFYSSTEFVTTSGSYLDLAFLFLNNPSLFLKQIIFGSISYFLDPLPYRFLQSEDPSHFWGSLYSIFFYLFLPSIFFGLYYKIRDRQINKYDFLLLAYFIAQMFILILTTRAVLRYRVSYWPILLIYGAHGWSLLPRWKKYIPRIILLYFFLFIFFTMFFNINKLIR